MWYRSVILLVILGFAQNADARASHSRPRRNLEIIGGKQVKINKVPFMALLWDAFFDVFQCGAAIVHKRFVLSARHCDLAYNEQFLRVVVGTDNLDNLGSVHKVDKAIFTNKDDDLMILKLKKELIFNENVQPIKMAAPGLVISDHEILDTMGFGMTDNQIHEPSKNLLKLDLPYVKQSKCNETYTDIKVGEICAGGIEGQSNCFGDSGGPLRYKDTLVGLVFRGHSPTCAEAGVPVVYTSVAYHRRFIDDVIKKN